jgi:hypothetical protein
MEKLVDEFMTRGYNVKQRSQYSTKVKEKDWGSPPIHAFIFFFTFLVAAVLFDAAGVSASGVWLIAILANITYAVYSWFTSEEIVIKVDETAVPGSYQ